MAENTVWLHKPRYAELWAAQLEFEQARRDVERETPRPGSSATLPGLWRYAHAARMAHLEIYYSF